LYRPWTRASPAVSEVEFLNVLRREELHTERERRLRGLDEEMHMVRHVAIPVQLPPSALHGDPEKSVEGQVVCRIDEEDFVSRRPLCDVEDSVGNVDAERARHAPNVAMQRGNR
jgi:hypothetical protein